ncbi:LOW QUALITY PROTEIN: hypothetical protein SORBI_3001G195400 [Sorghum bicolor]|uniref:Uncharacterized protein n=1 Tax=Sorghum bicolor TaxID=4558 RepID=C5WVE5_SORBI|nr:LOW QUALITY PROTEIN: hypothetical protein SORBI_3001G195400 [Sorghum bicolor]
MCANGWAAIRLLLGRTGGGLLTCVLYRGGEAIRGSSRSTRTSSRKLARRRAASSDVGVSSPTHDVKLTRTRRRGGDRDNVGNAKGRISYLGGAGEGCDPPQAAQVSHTPTADAAYRTTSARDVRGADVPGYGPPMAEWACRAPPADAADAASHLFGPAPRQHGPKTNAWCAARAARAVAILGGNDARRSASSCANVGGLPWSATIPGACSAPEGDGRWSAADGGGGGGGATVGAAGPMSGALQQRKEGPATMGRQIPAPRAAAAVAHPRTSRAAAAPERPAGEPLCMGVERREGWREEERWSGVQARAPAPLAAVAGEGPEARESSAFELGLSFQIGLPLETTLVSGPGRPADDTRVAWRLHEASVQDFKSVSP